MAEQEQPHVWVVGAEYDATLFARLGAALRSLGYEFENHAWGVAGSQELTTWHATSSLGTLSVEAETYVGLSVRGPKMLVAALQGRFAAMAPQGGA
jgi:hypothetical protein